MSARDLEVRADLVIPAHEIVETASRSGGPGGQHVNKTSTRVTLRWNAGESTALDDAVRRRVLRRLAPRLTRAGELVVHAGGERSRARNRERARARLAELVREAARAPRKRIATRPTSGSKKRRIAGKRARSEIKQARKRPGRDD